MSGPSLDRLGRALASRRTIWIAGAAAGLALFIAGLWGLDRAFPPPLDHPGGLSRVVKGQGGALLRTYAAPDGRWRLAIGPEEVDAEFIRMLVAYEDQRFWDHHGVDPLAMGRAAWQFFTHGGRIVSGGSTLTMQLARLIEPRQERSLIAKLRQMARALQIERRLGKEEILARYLSYAPYGGNIEGVRAASLAWFGREPRKLTLSQAALLVALPQSPETRRPDLRPDQARKARDRVLERMRNALLLPESEVARAARADVPAGRHEMPDLAAHLADTALGNHPLEAEIALTLDAEVQSRLEKLAMEAGARLGRRQSLAMVLADARSGEIIASVGSTGHLDAGRFGAIDMTRAVRSPGSALKPFIYGLAFEDAIVVPDTLIDDAPANFSGYRPRNFDLSYQGEVSVRAALQLSLNVPAVRLLEAVAPQRFLARLRRGGVRLEIPGQDIPGLAIGLGGAGVSLRELTQLYTAFANGGLARPLRDGSEKAIPQELEAPVLDSASTWVTLDVLSGVAAPEGAPRLAIAYKTGTSYGYRDAWAIGFDGRHVLGVWVGRADAIPVPGISGIATAAPILFEAFARSGLTPVALPRRPAGLVQRARGELPFALRKFRPDGGSPATALAASRLEIVFPPEGARVDLGAKGEGKPQRLALKMQGGTAPYRLIANGRPLPGTTRQRKLSWMPDGPGTSNLTVIDARGQAASVSLYVE